MMNIEWVLGIKKSGNMNFNNAVCVLLQCMRGKGADTILKDDAKRLLFEKCLLLDVPSRCLILVL